MRDAPRRRVTTRARLVAGAVAATLLAALPALPAKAAVVYTGNGFDACTAPSTDQMTAWLGSPYRSIGIYIGGANRACPDGNLSAAWITAVETQGWRLAPLYVGLQAPCASQAGLAPIDETQPAAQGTQAADDAAAHAGLLGLTQSSPIYFDMEGYAPNPNDAGCVPAVLGFVSAWTTELHRLGYLSGVYGSAASTISDQVAAIGTTPTSGIVDDIWFAHWNGQQTVFGDSFIPDGDWSQHQRLHQYAGGHVETYNGVSINIDTSYDDGALACVGGGASSGPVPPPASGPVVWSGPARQGPPSGPGVVAGAVSVVSAGPTRVDAFWRGRDNDLWTTSFAAGCGWSIPWSLGAGPLGSDPVAVSSAPGRIDVFWRGGDAGLWHMWNTGGGWNGPGYLGGAGTMASPPFPVSAAPTAMTVVWRSVDGNIGASGYSDATGWQGPFGLGAGPLGSDPHPVVWGSGRVALFWRGQDRNLWELSSAGGAWSRPIYLGSGPLGGDPRPASAGPGRIDVFWKGGDLGLWHTWTSDNAGWSGPATQGGAGTIAGNVMAVSTTPGRVATVWRAVDGNLWFAYYADGAGWTGAGRVGGGPLGSEPAAVAPVPGVLDVYWRGQDAGAWHVSSPGL